MNIEISLACAVLIFAILIFYLVKTLLVAQSTLKKINLFLVDVEMKSKNLDALLRSISNIGAICENETEQLKKEYVERRKKQENQECFYATSDWPEWLALSLKLGTKLLKKRCAVKNQAADLEY